MLKQGDRIFYTDNTFGVRNAGYCRNAVKVIHSLGLIYFYYPSISLKIKFSNIDAEAREDFYKAKVVILVLGKGKDWHELRDNWAIPKLECAYKHGIKLLIYTTVKLAEDEIKKLGLPLVPFFIKNQKHFETTLRADLQQLGIEKSLADHTKKDYLSGTWDVICNIYKENSQLTPDFTNFLELNVRFTGDNKWQVKSFLLSTNYEPHKKYIGTPLDDLMFRATKKLGIFKFEQKAFGTNPINPEEFKENGTISLNWDGSIFYGTGIHKGPLRTYSLQTKGKKRIPKEED